MGVYATRLDEAAYARMLRRSADATARRLIAGEIVEETRSRGSLKAAVLEALGDCPRTVECLAARTGKSKANVICSLRRLEAQGFARRAGKVSGAARQPVTTWVRCDD
ncbi:helix-turn-helix domain-containing protein [Albidovulum sp.]|uniref:helix-turn-helix domain-containing protein n=1 Tax=Albidovulum sp. TaxID=1872424 RepID=UPI0039B93375